MHSTHTHTSGACSVMHAHCLVSAARASRLALAPSSASFPPTHPPTRRRGAAAAAAHRLGSRGGGCCARGGAAAGAGLPRVLYPDRARGAQPLPTCQPRGGDGEAAAALDGTLLGCTAQGAGVRHWVRWKACSYVHVGASLPCASPLVCRCTRARPGSVRCPAGVDLRVNHN